jgi:hypothetical protein
MDGFTHSLPQPGPVRASVLATGWAAILAACLCGPAHAATENRSVANFDEVVIDVAGDVRVDQGPRETLAVEAEPAVLRKITTEVHARRLVIGLAPGRVETQQPIRLKLGVRTLRAFESRTIGAVSIGPLNSEQLALVLAGGGSIRLDRLVNGRNLDVRITGAGDVAVADGKVTAQKVDIAGMGSYLAPKLASERADVAIDGNGEVQLAASTALAVRIGGVGHVHYLGNPAVTRSIEGVGSIEKD